MLSASNAKTSVARKVSQSLQQGKLVELEARSKKGGNAALAVFAFLREVNQLSGAPPFRSRKMPLLTRLAGGLHAWKGTRGEYGERRKSSDLLRGPSPRPVRGPSPLRPSGDVVSAVSAAPLGSRSSEEVSEREKSGRSVGSDRGQTCNAATGALEHSTEGSNELPIRSASLHERKKNQQPARRSSAVPLARGRVKSANLSAHSSRGPSSLPLDRSHRCSTSQV